MIVEREDEPLRVFDLVPERLRGEIVLGRLGIDGEDVDVVPRLGEVAEHLLEAIRVSRYVREGGRLHQQCDLSRNWNHGGCV